MNWSSEQQAIFEHFKSGAGNLVIEAFAGTGKTTTITEAFSHAPEARILYAVFNKRNQKEAEEKIQDHRVEVKTLHALGFSFIKRVWPNAKRKTKSNMTASTNRSSHTLSLRRTRNSSGAFSSWFRS